MQAQQQWQETAEISNDPVGVILCVDDETQILSSLKRLFRRAGHTIVVASSASEGLEVLNTQEIDLVISDMRMPEMDGNHFLSEVASRWPQTVRMLLTGYSDMESTVGAINNGHIYRYIAKPWDDTDLLMCVKGALENKQLKDERDRLNRLTTAQNAQLSELNGSLEKQVEKRTAKLQEMAVRLKASNLQLESAYADSVAVFARIIGLREGEASSHGERIAELCQLVAQELGLDDQQQRDIHYAAQLHDIGKLAMSDELLQTPFETQTDEQKAVYKQHCTNGQAILMSLGPLQNAANIIRSHHEHVDGSGYPDQLKGDEIPTGAKILCVANGFDDLLLILSVDDLEPGMMLAEDVYLREKVLMLRSGQQLTESFIEKFRSLCQEADEAFLVKIKT